MKVLALDISSKTGVAILEDSKLLALDLISYKIQKKDYPWGTYAAAMENATLIFNRIKLHSEVDILILERTNNGRNRDSQSFLEYTHAFLLQMVKEAHLDHKLVYTDSSEWRRKVGLKMTDAQKKHNKLVKKQMAVSMPGLPRGKLTKKHLAVNMANSLFNLKLKLKDNDRADAVLVGLSYFK